MGYHQYKGHKARMVRNGARVRAVPPDEHSTTTAFGVDFPRGYWVNTGGLPQEHQDRLSGNPGFTAADKPPKGEPVIEKPDIGPIHMLNDPHDDSADWADADEEAPSKGAAETDEAAGGKAAA